MRLHFKNKIKPIIITVFIIICFSCMLLFTGPIHLPTCSWATGLLIELGFYYAIKHSKNWGQVPVNVMCGRVCSTRSYMVWLSKGLFKQSNTLGSPCLCHSHSSGCRCSSELWSVSQWVPLSFLQLVLALLCHWILSYTLGNIVFNHDRELLFLPCKELL